MDVKRNTSIKLSASTPTVHLEDLSHEWRQIRKANHFDSKLYARGMAIFGHQKMNMPVHELVFGEYKRNALISVQNLRNVKDPLDESDLPFFW